MTYCRNKDDQREYGQPIDIPSKEIVEIKFKIAVVSGNQLKPEIKDFFRKTGDYITSYFRREERRK